MGLICGCLKNYWFMTELRLILILKQGEVKKKNSFNKKRNLLSSKSHTKYSFSIKIASSGKTIYELLLWIEAINKVYLFRKADLNNALCM